MDTLTPKERKRLIKERKKGKAVDHICNLCGVSRKTFYYHWNNFQKDGWDGLKHKSRKPNKVYKTPERTVKFILKLRREFSWGPVKIERYLRKEQPEGIKLVGHNTIYRIICKVGLNDPIDEPRKTWGKRRFVRKEPNELWQADFKLTDDDKWMLTYLDDYSRFIPGSEIFDDATSWNTIYLLQDCIDKYGAPKQVLTDQGAQFYTTQEEGKTKFTKFCERHDIQHIVASKRRPTTIGKVERFHGSYVREAHLFPTHSRYIHHWNYVRPHQGIDYLTPAKLYFNTKL